MLFSSLIRSSRPKQPPRFSGDHAILIVEDDENQMELLSANVVNELHHLLRDSSLSETQRDKLTGAKIVKIGDLRSLKEVAESDLEIILTVLDCQIPSRKGATPTDQFEKQEHLITGQYRSVDLLVDNHPKSPVLLISALDRFRNPVIQFYKSVHRANLGFVHKRNPEKISSRVREHLQAWVHAQ